MTIADPFGLIHTFAILRSRFLLTFQRQLLPNLYTRKHFPWGKQNDGRCRMWRKEGLGIVWVSPWHLCIFPTTTTLNVCSRFSVALLPDVLAKDAKIEKPAMQTEAPPKKGYECVVLWGRKMPLSSVFTSNFMSICTRCKNIPNLLLKN